MLDITPIVHDWAVPFLTVLLLGLVVWIVAMTKSWLDAHAAFLDAQTREKITQMEESALDQGVQYVLAWVQRECSQVHPQVNSWLLREGAQVAINHASGILKDNGADPDELANRILAKFPTAYVTTDVNTAAKLPAEYTATVDVSPLPPLPTH